MLMPWKNFGLPVVEDGHPGIPIPMKVSSILQGTSALMNKNSFLDKGRETRTFILAEQQ
jgi:hypothetical protein